jgi:hypothetical protein
MCKSNLFLLNRKSWHKLSLLSILLTGSLLLLLGCGPDPITDEGPLDERETFGAGSRLRLSDSARQTTHYCNVKSFCPVYHNPGMGPKFFHCNGTNGTPDLRGKFNDNRFDTAKYIALSDQIEEIKWCDGAQCYPNNPICGKKVRISCRPAKGDKNCDPRKKSVIATVTDFCPVRHAQRYSGQTPPFCGDGQTVADLSDQLWNYFRGHNKKGQPIDDNLKLTFEKVGW